MRIFLVIIAIAIAIAALGLYRGWYHVESENSADNPSVTVTVDKGNIRQDRQKTVDTVEDWAQQAKDEVAAPASPATNPAQAK